VTQAPAVLLAVVVRLTRTAAKAAASPGQPLLVGGQPPEPPYAQPRLPASMDSTCTLPTCARLSICKAVCSCDVHSLMSPVLC
jgi:hypothetical protein